MKKIAIGIMTAVILMAAGICAAAQEAVIKINGEVLNTDTAPVNIEGRILVPLRSIAEALECDVCWNDVHRAVTVFDGDYLCMLWIDRDTAFKFGSTALEGGTITDVPPKIINDRTMVPIRCVAELLGAKVDWIDDEKTVTVEYTPKDYGDLNGTAQSDSLVELMSGSYYGIYRDYISERKSTQKAEIELENGGIIKLELYKDIAPITVENFTKLAREGQFDGKIFHRVIKDFMIQGGAFDTEMNYSEADTITGEFLANGILNLVPHTRGTISMARTNAPDSASNQFFIMHKTSPHLDGMYAAFGRVYEGIEYVDMIADVQTDEYDCPAENQIIKTVRILADL